VPATVEVGGGVIFVEVRITSEVSESGIPSS
jgi:hypothetical protein